MLRLSSNWTCGRKRRRYVLGATLGLLFAAAAVPTGLALAAPSGSVSETINVGPPPVLSITVSTSQVSMCSQASPLTFPNGECTSPAITVTNGTTPANIEVAGNDAVPSDENIDPGTSPPDWDLCSPVATTTCTGGPSGSSATNPGQDQYWEATYGSSVVGPFLADAPALQCDTAFNDGSCVATADQSESERLVIIGPSASTDQSQTFTTEVTWTAETP